jgi:hypothetical protein
MQASVRGSVVTIRPIVMVDDPATVTPTVIQSGALPL